MCLSLPFRIYFKDISEIIKDCFLLKEEKKKSKKSDKSEINMDLIEAQPIKSEYQNEVFIPSSGDELEQSYDLMDS